MKHTKLTIALLLLAVCTARAQSTDPMIINWWFNTTSATYSGILTDVEAVYYNANHVFVKTSGVPNYYRHGVSVNDAVDLNATWQIPRNPVPASTPPSIMGGQEGLMLDGSVFFHPGDARSYMNAGVWNQLAYYFEGVDMDSANGHSTPTNMYHHHFDNLKLHTFDSTLHSPIVGYAWDGYPVYGPYGYVNADGTGGITRMTSSYKTKTYTTRTSGPAVGGAYPIGCYIEDWEYSAGYGILDAHNGRFTKTPEYPDGTYAYFTTVDASLLSYYPYFVGPTFYGNILASNTGPSGGNATVSATDTLYNPPLAVTTISALDSKVQMYPVPVINTLTIQLTESKPYAICIYDISGKVVERRTINATTAIDMSSQPYGPYFVQVEEVTGGNGFVKRIVKQ